MTEPGSHEDQRLRNEPDFERVPGEPFGDPLDIRDPRNVDERSPIEGATHEALGVADGPVDSSRVSEDDSPSPKDSIDTGESESVQSGDTVKVTKEDEDPESYDLRHG